MSERQRVPQAHHSRGQNDCNSENDISSEEGIETGEDVQLSENVNRQVVQAPGDINPERHRRLEYMSLIIQHIFHHCLKPNFSYPEVRRLPSKDVNPKVGRVPGEEVNSEKGKPQFNYVNPKDYKSPRDIISEKVREPGHIPSIIITYFEAFKQQHRNNYFNPQVGRVPSEDVNSKKDKTQYEDMNPKDSQAPSDNNRGANWVLGYIRFFVQNTYERYLKPNFNYPKERRVTSKDFNPELGRKQYHDVDSEKNKPQCEDVNPEDCQTAADESMEGSVPGFDAFF